MLPSLCRLSVGVGRGGAPPLSVGVQPSPVQPGGSGSGPSPPPPNPFESLSDDALVTVLTKADCRSATKLCEVLKCSKGVWENACIERGWAAGKPVDRTWKEQFAYRCEHPPLADDTIREAVNDAMELSPPHVHPFYGPIADWDVSEVTNMKSMFWDAYGFNGDLSRWNVGKVTNMSGMFVDAKAFNGDLSRWDVSNVTEMGRMFMIATAFNGDLSRWDVSNVTNMDIMFWGARAFNGDLSRWDVSKVTKVRDIIRTMFVMTDAYRPVHKIGTRSGLPRPERPLLPLLPDRSTWPQWPNPLPKVPTLLPLDD